MTREPSPLGERFGANLSRCRRRAGLSQDGLADLVGLTRGHLGELERGRQLPRIDTVLRLAAAMEASTCVLLEGMEWRPGLAGSWGLLPATFRRASAPTRTEPPMKTISPRIPDQMATELYAVAGARGAPVSEAIRAAIHRYIGTRCAEETFQERLRSGLREDREVLETLSDDSTGS